MKHSLGLGTLLFSVAVSLGAGFFTIWFVWDDLSLYEAICNTPFSAPLWLILPLCAFFCVLLGVAIAKVLAARLPHKDLIAVARRWLVLILISFAQTAVFFRFEYLTISFALAALNLVLCVSSALHFARFNRSAGLCMMFCVLWQFYLCYLGLTAAATI